MEIRIRKLAKEDFQKGFLESLSNLFMVGLTIGEAEKIYQKVCYNPVYRLFVAELDGEVVGVTTLLVEQKFLLKGAKFGYIEDVATRKGFERKGIGRLLQEVAIKEAQKEGCCLVRLDSKEKNVPFYEKCGFSKKDGTFRMQINLNTPSLDS